MARGSLGRPCPNLGPGSRPEPARGQRDCRSQTNPAKNYPPNYDSNSNRSRTGKENIDRLVAEPERPPADRGLSQKQTRRRKRRAQGRPRTDQGEARDGGPCVSEPEVRPRRERGSETTTWSRVRPCLVAGRIWPSVV